MIRLPATTIILGRSDLLDYEKRQRTRGRDRERISETDKLNERLARFTVRSQPGSTDLDRGNADKDLSACSQDHHEQSHLQNPKQLVQESAITIESPEISDEHDAESASQNSTVSQEDVSTTNPQDEEHGYVNVGFEHSPENATQETPRPASPSKHDFYYGGFIESASPSLTDYTPHSTYSSGMKKCYSDHKQRRTMLLLRSNCQFRPQIDFVPEINYPDHLFTYLKMRRAPQIVVQLLA